MEEPEITVQDVKQQLQRIKEKISPGPDGMKPDIFKILGTDEQCTQVLTYVLNKIMRQEDMSPNSWALSKTIMVPKKKKPTMVTYLIIEKMYDCLNGINTNICKIVALFFADDGISLMQSLEEA